MKIPLTNSSLFAEIDDSDFSIVSGHKWYLHSGGYAAAPNYHDGITDQFYMHILILGQKFVDHKDRNKLNNRRSNLRPATRSQNNGNRKKQTKPTSSKFKGVVWRKDNQKWRAVLQMKGNGRTKSALSLGNFINETDAAKAYNVEAKRRFGGFALLNDV